MGSRDNEGMKSASFASRFKDNTFKKTVHLSELRNGECVSGADVSVRMACVDDVSGRFANTLYGYFIGKRLVFLIVENYDKNTWAKYGVERIMSSNGFFFFQFATKEGMEQVLENGPWLIRLVLIILNTWTLNTRLKKAEITMALASTSQPKETVHKNTQPTANKVSSKSDDINIISFKNSFDALKDQDDVFGTDKLDWQKSNNSETTVNDSDSEEVKNVFVRDNGKPIDGLVDDPQKKVKTPLRKTPMKTSIWSG
nr:hypothetical protein [Tanacetum cinerariifolium]